MFILAVPVVAEQVPLEPSEMAARLQRFQKERTHVEVKRDLFYLEKRAAPPVRPLERRPVESPPPRLVGAFASGGRQQAFFLVEGRSVSATEGDVLGDYRVARIDSSGVVLEHLRSGQRLRLGLTSH